MAAWMAPVSCGTMSRNLWCFGHSNRDAAATALRDLCRRLLTNNLLPPRERGSMLECLVHRILELGGSYAHLQAYSKRTNQTGHGRPGHSTALGAAGRSEDDRHQIRLRHLGMRCMHRAPGGSRDSLVRSPG